MAATESLALSDFLARVSLVVHGTTITTNAVLTGEVARVGLLTTRGFRDALAMRRGIREVQYDNRYAAPAPLVPRWLRLPVSERVDAAGAEVAPLVAADVAAALRTFAAAGVEAVAICFLHSWANPAHEIEAERMAASTLPAAYLSRSSALLPQIRFTERVSTTVLNAAVGPVLRGYLDRLVQRLAGSGFGGALLVMQSNGGVASPATARTSAASTLLSGPAAAPPAALAWAGPHGWRDFITMDMGGTSFDVALVRDGAPAMTTEGRIARYPFGLPVLAIHTIGAGGGSLGWIDEGGLLRMGPRSAGAEPGPACYGRGGAAPTCTDADLVLGYLDPDRFLDGRLRLDREAAVRAIRTAMAAPLGLSVEDAAAGMVAVIDASMAAGIRHVTIERGEDPRGLPLVVAGGAGGVHAAGIAAELGLTRLLVPRDSSILCAAGMLFSDLRHDGVRSCVASLDALEPGRLAGVRDALLDEARALLAGEGVAKEAMAVALSCDVRYVGQHHEIAVPWAADEAAGGDLAAVAKRFHEAHDALYGYAVPEAALELVNVRAVAIGRTERPPLPELAPGRAAAARRGTRPAWVATDRAFAAVALFDGLALGAGARLDGPAIVELPMTAVVVPPAWRVEVDGHGSFLVERV